jgi:hypothetical protein
MTKPNWTFKEFDYPTSTRATVDGVRVYSINDEKLPICYNYTSSHTI